MTARKIPGGALAVIRNHRLVHAKGYGWADREARMAARADTLFRIASISKPITAVTILKLVEAGRLDLDARAFELLNLMASPAFAAEAPTASGDFGTGHRIHAGAATGF